MKMAISWGFSKDSTQRRKKEKHNAEELQVNQPEKTFSPPSRKERREKIQTLFLGVFGGLAVIFH
jgi:hypothetical protein